MGSARISSFFVVLPNCEKSEMEICERGCEGKLIMKKLSLSG